MIAVLLASDTVIEPGGTAQFPSATGFRVTMVWIGALTFVAAFAGLFLKARQDEEEPQKRSTVVQRPA
jgi:hypothetical protein